MLSGAEVRTWVGITFNIRFWWQIALFRDNSAIHVLFVFLHANHALAENVPPRPWEMTTFYNVSGLPPHMPPLFPECHSYGNHMYRLENLQMMDFHENLNFVVKSMNL